MIKGIYDEGKKRDPSYFIKFVDDNKRNILAWMVGDDGHACGCTNLFSMDKTTGTITLNSDVNPVFGFDLDECGKLKVK